MITRLTVALAMAVGWGWIIAAAAEPATPPSTASSRPKPAATPPVPEPAAKSSATKAEAAKKSTGTKGIAITIHAGKPPAPKPARVKTAWSQSEITMAKAHCASMLSGLDVVVIPEPSFRKGACGSAAPMRVISIGRNPEVALSPPPVLSCDMVAALAGWVTSVQPLAKEHLGEPIIRIDTMSDYSCRAAYGRKGNRLSEHGLANALDIRGFFTARGRSAAVASQWGKTRRDIARAISIAKAAAEKAEKKRIAAAGKAAKASAAAAPKAQAPVQIQVKVKVPAAATPPAVTAMPAASKPAEPEFASTSPQANISASAESVETQTTPGDLFNGALDAVSAFVKSTIIDGAPETANESANSQALVARSMGAPQFLGGPKKNGVYTAALPDSSDTAVVISKKGRFLREAHAAACRIFGTTLGPEANNAHRNHFHFDMAQRNAAMKYCR